MERRGLDDFSLVGKRILVTGASRGIGAAIATGCAEAGADVAVLARSAERLSGVAAAIRAAGHHSLALSCDVRDADDVNAAVEAVRDSFGGIDVLVNNAGGPVFQSSFLDVREEGWQTVLDLNLTSVMRMCQACGRLMTELGAGSIINIASVVPTRVWPAILPYSTAKAAVVHMTQALAVEWGAAGVRVNAICPGWIRTEANRAYLDDPQRASTTIDAVPLGRWGDAGDAAGAVVWLASDASRYVTGAVIPVDGGLAVGLSSAWQAEMRLG